MSIFKGAIQAHKELLIVLWAVAYSGNTKIRRGRNLLYTEPQLSSYCHPCKEQGTKQVNKVAKHLYLYIHLKNIYPCSEIPNITLYKNLQKT